MRVKRFTSSLQQLHRSFFLNKSSLLRPRRGTIPQSRRNPMMGTRSLWCFILLSFCIFLNSGSSSSESPSPEEYKQNRSIQNQEPFSPSAYLTQLDSIPIINPTTPTTPTTPTPMVIPTSPPAPTTTDPYVTPSTPTPTTIPVSASGSWCIASSIASPTALQVALDYACGYGGADCSAIQQGAGCYEPNTVRDHASYAFNDYYQKNPVPASCVFGGTAQLSTADPSHDNCHFASPRTTPSTTSPVIPPPVIPTTPTTTTPTISPPTDSSPYGPEPTGSPSSTAILSPFLPFLFVTSGLLATILTANNF